MEELTVKISAASSGSSGTEARIQELVDRVESVQEKMYDFEVNKRNNLLFYGVREDRRETPAELHNKVTSGHFSMGCFYLHRFTAQIRAILRDNLSLKRDIAVSCASRMFSGPDVGGFRWSKHSLNSDKYQPDLRPVVVTFEEFKDRDEVLRKAGLLKGGQVHVTEDMSRKVRSCDT